MKSLSAFATTFRNSKLSGKIAIGCSALLLLCLCTSVPVGILSSLTTTEEPATVDIFTPIFETSQAIAGLTQSAATFTPVPTTALVSTDTPLPSLPTATLEPSIALPANVASCVPTGSTREEGLVIGIVDGDTIDVAIGNETYRVRYIGVDTPERDEELYWLATGENQNLVYAQQITLVKDVSETDQFDRLLRYIFVGDTFVNYELVNRGYAQAATYSPDVSCADYFVEAQAQAQAAKLGLWAPAPPLIVIPAPTQSGSSYSAPTNAPSRPSSCCKICGANSKPCGDSCISLNYTCHKPPGCACDG